ncbi:MAG: SRPBCC family protein, partial [Salinispira sp.]
MQYTTEIIITCPLEKTIELFDSVENLKKWQVGLLSMETIEGQPGKAGAKSRLVYQMGKGEFIMEEEIIENKLPESIHFIYRSGKTMETVNDNKNFFSRTE